VIRAFPVVTNKAGIGQDWGLQADEAYLRIGPVGERYSVESMALLAGQDRTATTE
jgi:hypothetical protein